MIDKAMDKIPVDLDLIGAIDRGRAKAASGYHLAKPYLPSVVRRAMPMHLGRNYRFTFTLKTTEGTTVVDVPIGIKFKRTPDPSGLYTMCHEVVLVSIHKDMGYPSDFYASQVVEIAQRSIEFIDSILPYIRDPNTSMDSILNAAVRRANAIRAGSVSDIHVPCVEQALLANVYDADMSYQYMRHGLVVGQISLDATVLSYIDQHDPTATLTTNLCFLD